ncbi:MAG TPA: hypothetical protein PLA44_03665 [Propionibacteriaceae bacterium]|nr:hypothetical protein [Propionibacteriaceae bacterium]
MRSVQGGDIRLGTSSFSAMTYNLWGETFLARRLEAVRALFTLRPPDLLATQELTPTLRAALDEVLPTHARVHDDHPGWSTQSNLWWRTAMFELVDHGWRDVGIISPHAGLFWVRLRPLAPASPPEIVVSTAHLTYQRHPDELADLSNRRVPQARRIVAALDEIAGDAPVIFTADFNDIAPAHLVFGQAGYLDSYTALARNLPATHPLPGASSMEGVWSPNSPIAGVRKGIDALFSRGPLVARLSEVVEFHHDGQIPSDHAPVTTMYTFADITP